MSLGMTATTCRTYWETMTRLGGKRLVREYLDAAGRVVRFEVVATVGGAR